MQCLWRSNLGTRPSEISNPVRADVTSRRSASRMVLPAERAHARELRSAAEEWDLVKLSGDRLNLPGKRANLQRSIQNSRANFEHKASENRCSLRAEVNCCW